MKVFISSTCYDLVDLRLELAEELRAMGCSPMLSDERASDFEVSGTAGENSIQTCLNNVRQSDAVIVILSQRYGPKLPPPLFDPVSATHLEYREAQKSRKRLYFYVRDRLAADFDLWLANGRSDTFKGAWVKESKDNAMFHFLDEHRKLVQSGKTDTNNWLDRFTCSVDLRADLRRRFAPQIAEVNARRLVQSGQVPVLVPFAPDIERVLDGAGRTHFRFKFEIVNAGPVTAIQVETRIASHAPGVLDTVEFYTLAPTPLASVPPGNDPSTRLMRSVAIEILGEQIERLVTSHDKKEVFQWQLLLDSMTPTGYIFTDHHTLELQWDGTNLTYRRPACYAGKSFVTAGDLFIHSPRLALRPSAV